MTIRENLPARTPSTLALTFALALAMTLAMTLVAPPPAQAATLRLDWTLQFDYPPNPCNDQASLASLSLGLFEPGSSTGEYLSLLLVAGPPALPSGGRAAGSQVFAATEGTAIYAAYRGALQCAGSPSLPVYAFAASIETGDSLLEDDPGAAPFVQLGALREGAWIPNPGPPDLPLFAFASPGLPAGTLILALTAVPEPSTGALLLAGLATLIASRRQRQHAHEPLRARPSVRTAPAPRRKIRHRPV